MGPQRCLQPEASLAAFEPETVVQNYQALPLSFVWTTKFISKINEGTVVEVQGILYMVE